MKEMRWLTLFTIFCIVLIGLVGCDNFKCNPEVKPDQKDGEKGWYIGGRCGGNF